MSRWGDERDGAGRRRAGPGAACGGRGCQGQGGPHAAGMPARELPGANRTREERERNQRKEVNEERKGDNRRLAPYASEQRMMGLLAELGERYRIDYQREYKIKDERNGWFVTHVDGAWPKDRLVIVRCTAGCIASGSSTRPAHALRTSSNGSTTCGPVAGACWSSTTQKCRASDGGRPWSRWRSS